MKFLRIKRSIIRRVLGVAASVIDLFVINPIVAAVTIPFKGFGYAGDILDAATISSVLKIYDYLFKFYGDPDYMKKIRLHILDNGGIPELG